MVLGTIITLIKAVLCRLQWLESIKSSHKLCASNLRTTRTLFRLDLYLSCIFPWIDFSPPLGITYWFKISYLNNRSEVEECFLKCLSTIYIQNILDSVEEVVHGVMVSAVYFDNKSIETLTTCPAHSCRVCQQPEVSGSLYQLQNIITPVDYSWVTWGMWSSIPLMLLVMCVNTGHWKVVFICIACCCN